MKCFLNFFFRKDICKNEMPTHHRISNQRHFISTSFLLFQSVDEMRFPSLKSDVRLRKFQIPRFEASMIYYNSMILERF